MLTVTVRLVGQVDDELSEVDEFTAKARNRLGALTFNIHMRRLPDKLPVHFEDLIQ
jgi:hypothetical protein